MGGCEDPEQLGIQKWGRVLSPALPALGTQEGTARWLCGHPGHRDVLETVIDCPVLPPSLPDTRRLRTDPASVLGEALDRTGCNSRGLPEPCSAPRLGLGQCQLRRELVSREDRARLCSAQGLAGLCSAGLQPDGRGLKDARSLGLFVARVGS